MLFHKESEEDLKGKLAAAITEIIRHSEWFHDVRVEVVDQKERLVRKDCVMLYINERSYTSLGSYFRSVVESFRAGPNKSVSEDFRADFIWCQFDADGANSRIKLRFLEGVALEDGGGSTKGEDVVGSLMTLVHRFLVSVFLSSASS